MHMFVCTFKRNQRNRYNGMFIFVYLCKLSMCQNAWIYIWTCTYMAPEMPKTSNKKSNNNTTPAC